MSSPPVTLLLLALLSAPLPAAATSWIGWDLECDSQELRLADPRHAWRLLDGFSEIVADGRTIEGDAGVLLILGDPQEGTTLHVEARTGAKKVDLLVELNGQSLGRGTLGKKLRTLAFPAPPGVARRGLNVLRLEATTPRAKRTPRLTLRRVGVGPLRCRGKDPEAIDVAAGEPMVLSRSSLVMIPIDAAGAEAPDQVAVSFMGRPFAGVGVACWTESEVVPIARLEGGHGSRARSFLPLADGCASAHGLALLGEGPGRATNVRVDVGRDEGLGWRGKVRLQMALLLLAIAGVGTAVAVRLRSRGRLEWSGAGVPWLDVGGIVLVALLPRMVFWVFYPYPGQAGDSYEYLLRAGFLTRGELDFWRDLDWHTWGHFIRPPGYFALLAWLDAPSTAGRTSVMGLHLALSALTAGLTYLLTLPLFGRLAAWCAGLFFAFYLGSITTFTRILAEPVYVFFAVAGLAGVAWLGKRPGWKLALAAGVCFGLAALVRPGPAYFPPLAGLLLIPTLGWRKGLRLTAALVLGLAAMVLPWSLRNSLVAGQPLGVETVSIANFLISHPDEEWMSVGDLDLARGEDARLDPSQIHHLERSRLTTDKGPHVRRILLKAARDPGAHLRRVGVNLRDLLGPAPDHWLRWILSETDAVRVARLTSLLNLQYGLLLALAMVGFAAFLRQPRLWPVAAWFFFNTAVLTFFFFAMARYREPTTPVLMGFAGGLVAALVERRKLISYNPFG